MDTSLGLNLDIFADLFNEHTMDKTHDLKSFHYYEDGEIGFSETATIKSQNTLDPGLYKLSIVRRGPSSEVIMHMVHEGETSKVHEFSKFQEVDTLFKVFYSPDTKKIMKDLGFYNKTGILLYGKEGTGKTTILRHFYLKGIAEHNALVFFLPAEDEYNFNRCWDLIAKIRVTQDNPIIVVFEEVDELLEQHYLEATLKKIMDGPSSIDNVVFMGTTNYIEKIPDSIKSRPSRFKYCIEIEPIKDVKVLRTVIRSILKDTIDDKEVAALSKDLSGETIDVIKHRCLDILTNVPTNVSILPKIGFKS